MDPLIKGKLTVDDLTRLDNYGHRELEQITEIELNEYATLLQMRRQEVLKRIQELRSRGDKDHQ